MGGHPLAARSTGKALLATAFAGTSGKNAHLWMSQSVLSTRSHPAGGSSATASSKVPTLQDVSPADGSSAQ